MTGSLFDQTGIRKYLVASERFSFISAAMAVSGATGSFCLTLALTGARISEVLALTADRIDIGNEAIVFETLKRRKIGTFRAVPAPVWLLLTLENLQHLSGARLWPWGRTTGWKIVKSMMKNSGIPEYLCKPKSLRHAFAVEAGQKGIPLNIVQRWLGHARIETTAIYASAIGDEERNLASKLWQHPKTSPSAESSDSATSLDQQALTYGARTA